MDEKEILKAVFGESDSEEDDVYSSIGSPFYKVGDDQKMWEEVPEISGLWVCRDFLSVEEQEGLVSAILREGWFEDPSHNQAMRFGDLPGWALRLCELVRNAICSYDVVCKICNTSTTCAHHDEKGSPFSPELLWREPLFNQMIVNAYQPGEGICAHIDLLRFEDGIAIISLESACVMQFTQLNVVNEGVRCSEELCSTDRNLREVNTGDSLALALKVPILLMPGDIILMSGEARYNWSHEINRKAGYQIWNGEEIAQRRRISVTLRRLCQAK